jgi:hypothetical protein
MNKGKWISDSSGLGRTKPFGRCGGSAPSNYKERGKVSLENYGEGLFKEEEEIDPELVEMERKIQERIEKEKRNKVQGSNPFGVITALKK